MDYFDVVKTRRSTRAFLPRDVEPEKVQAVLEAANCAPSAGNLQAYEIYLVTRRATMRALAEASFGQDFVAQAPLALAFFAHPKRCAFKYGRRGTSLYCIQDATIACTYAQLAATALGVATVWIGAFDDDSVREAIGVDKDLVPVAILPIGYAGETPAETSRRPLPSLVNYIS